MPIIQIRRATDVEWSGSTRILLEGELALETTTGKLKVGDGSKTFNQLEYINLLPFELTQYIREQIDAFFEEGTGINFDHVSTGSINDVFTVSVDTEVIATKVYVDDAVNSLGNTVDTTYIPISARGNIDGVASLGPEGFIPDSEIPSTIARDSELTSHNSSTTNVHGIADTSVLLTTSGGILTGSLTLPGDPTNSLHAATKQYVDAVSEGLHVHASCVAATTANIDLATDAQNGSIIDGVTLSTGDRILIKNQTNKTQNGIYVVSATGSPVRAIDFDTPTEIDGGDLVFVLNGTQNDNTSWVQTNIVGTIGTDDVEFTQFSGAGTYSAGNGLALNGNQFSVDNTIARLASPTFTGTVGGITKSMVGLGNVDNTSDVNKPVSTAVQTELDKKTDELYIYVAIPGAATATASAHKYKMLHFNNTGSVIFTLPSESTDPGWEVGSSLEIRQMNTGQIEVQAESPATLVSAENQYKTRVRYSSLFIEKIGANQWIMTGDTIA